ncbi:MAG: hypothetical protein AAF289_21465, partial [Cyanobacteria bacterium P01_A01_bin.135]
DRLVLDSQTMAEVGRVDTLWMYPQRNRVLGVICRPGRFGAQRLVFKLTQMTAAEEGLVMQGEPEPTVAAKVQQLESLIDQEVWSDRGERVGKIVDCLFNPENGVILRYLIVSSPWASLTEGTLLLSPKQIVSFSAKRTLITAEAADALAVYEPGLRQRLAQIREMLKEDYVNSVARELQSLSTQVQSQFQSFTQRAQGQMESLLQQTRERARSVSEDFSRDAQAAMQTLQSEIQAVAERVEEAIPNRPDEDPTASTVGESNDKSFNDDGWDWPGFDQPEVDRPEIHQPKANRQGSPPSAIDQQQAPGTAADDWEGWDEVPASPSPIAEPDSPVDDSEPPLEPAPAPAANQATPNQSKSPIITPAPAEVALSDLEPDERDIWDDWEADDPSPIDAAPSEVAGGTPPNSTDPPTEGEDPWV